ncbi:unnamed protein product [Adineta steineri]|uniref:Uncharacterized protein n=1 Tax=Adineta steineri TaxID=433720 RepID=A0A818IVN4_9BILA|nr:unnamed protein product [Adineta steineri]CAF3531448.1 unnamed protein product [Adineta steineri]
MESNEPKVRNDGSNTDNIRLAIADQILREEVSSNNLPEDSRISNSSDASEPSVEVPAVELHAHEDSSGEQPSVITGRQREPLVSTNKKYRIHMGTRPGSYSPIKLPYEKVQPRHQKLTNLLSEFQSNLESSGFKQIPFNILLKDAVSDTKDWSFEPYASIILVPSSQKIVQGVAAIVGRIFEQDGIGIFDDSDDYRPQQIGRCSDINYSIRCFITISQRDSSGSALPISNYDARQIMGDIRKKYPDLSGQQSDNSQRHQENV